MSALHTIHLSTMDDIEAQVGQPAVPVATEEQYEIVFAVGSAKWLRIGPQSAMVILDRSAGFESQNDDLEQILKHMAQHGLCVPRDTPDLSANDVEIWMARPIAKLPTPRRV